MNFQELTIPLTEKQKIQVFKTEKYYVHTSYGKLLDAHMGNTAFIFGFDNVHIKQKMRELQDKIAYVHCKPNEFCEENNELVAKICSKGNYAALAWAVSGSDGVECAIAMNDTYWRNLGTTKNKVICFSPGWHGTTYITRAMRKEENLDKLIILDTPNWQNSNEQEQQENSLLQQIIREISLDDNIGAIIYESIPWLRGIMPWSQNFHKKLRNICDEYKLNLILDDVMGGVGKLGEYFSFKKFGIQPDITILGKAFTGGYSPLSCACTTQKIADVIRDNHFYSHTWQPNMGGVGAALGVLDIFDEKQLYNVEKNLCEFGDLLVQKGLVEKYYCEGLIFHANTFHKIDVDRFLENKITGLGGWDLEVENVSLVAPAIADDEYFDQLTNRVIQSLEKLR